MKRLRCVFSGHDWLCLGFLFGCDLCVCRRCLKVRWTPPAWLVG